MIRLGLAIVTLMLLGIVLPALLVEFSTGHPIVLGASLAGLTCGYAAVRLSHLVWDGRSRLLEVVFWAFVYTFLGVAPLAQMLAGTFPWPGEYRVETIASAYGLVYAGLIAYDLGRLVGMDSCLPRRGFEGTNWNVGPVRSLGLLILAFLSAGLLIYQMGGLVAFAVPRALFLETVSGGVADAAYGLKISLLRVPPFVASLALIALWTRRRGRSRSYRVGIGLIMVSAVALTLLTSNPVTSARFWSGTVLLGFVSMVVSWSPRWSSFVWGVGLVVGLTVLFPFVDVYRNTLDPGSVTKGRTLIETVHDKLIKGDYASFQQLLNSQRAVSRDGTLLGEQLLATALFWVPRSVWLNKPQYTGQWIAKESGYGFTNLEAPLWAEGYVNAGLPGVVLLLLLYGIVTGVLTKALAGQQTPNDFLRMLVSIIAPYQLFLLRGSLSVAVGFLAPTIVLITVLTVPMMPKRTAAFQAE